MALVFLSPLHKASRQISLYMEERMGDTEFSPQEGHLLSYLRTYAPCPISELVRVFGIKPSTLGSILDRLERQGILKRVPNLEDRRSFLIKLTRRGRAVANELQQLVEQLEANLLAKVSTDDLKGFRAVMAAIEATTLVAVRPRAVSR